MPHRTPEDMRKDYIAALGADFGSIYLHVFNEWCDLKITWKQFKNLFCSGPERVDLMNRCGAEFFYRVDRIFFESVLLALCRLTDPPMTGKKQNLSVALFAQFMTTDARKQQMGELVGAAIKSTAFARDWRNRRVGHNDYDLLLNGNAPLEKATILLVDASVDCIYQILLYVNKEFRKVELHNGVIDDLNNEMVMLERLYRGDLSFQDELERLAAHEFHELPLPGWLTNGPKYRKTRT
jgi:hypothetical protein